MANRAGTEAIRYWFSRATREWGELSEESSSLCSADPVTFVECPFSNASNVAIRTLNWRSNPERWIHETQYQISGDGARGRSSRWLIVFQRHSVSFEAPVQLATLQTTNRLATVSLLEACSKSPEQIFYVSRNIWRCFSVSVQGAWWKFGWENIINNVAETLKEFIEGF